MTLWKNLSCISRLRAESSSRAKKGQSICIYRILAKPKHEGRLLITKIVLGQTNLIIFCRYQTSKHNSHHTYYDGEGSNIHSLAKILQFFIVHKTMPRHADRQTDRQTDIMLHAAILSKTFVYLVHSSSILPNRSNPEREEEEVGGGYRTTSLRVKMQLLFTSP